MKDSRVGKHLSLSPGPLQFETTRASQLRSPLNATSSSVTAESHVHSTLTRSVTTAQAALTRARGPNHCGTRFTDT